MAEGCGDFEDVGAAVDGAGGEGMPQAVGVQPGDAAGAVAEPAEQAVCSSTAHRLTGDGGEQRPGGIAAVLEPVVDGDDGRGGQDRGAGLAAFLGDAQHGRSLLGVQVGQLQGEGFANTQPAQQQHGDQSAIAGPAGGRVPEPAGLDGVQR